MIQEQDFAVVFQHNPQFSTIKKLYEQDRWLFDAFVELLIDQSEITDNNYRDRYDDGCSNGYQEGYDDALQDYEEGIQ